MSYSQFGYAYPSSTQVLVSGGGKSPCCQPASDGGSPPQVYTADTRLLSQIPRLTSFGLYGTSYADHISSLASNTTFYSTLGAPYDLKESRNSWNAALQQSCYPYDPIAASSYTDRYSSMESVARRKNATRETTNTLKAWLYEHRKNPYPTKGEKIMLAIITKMTLTQVSTWFANARRRLKKENKMTWEPRNKTSEEDENSISPHDMKSDDTADECTTLNDFLKQEPFHGKESYPAESPVKSCAMECYRTQSLSSEDSITSGTSSPVRTFSGFQQPGKSDTKGFDSNNRPKIWSLARTATSNSPPANRRSLQPMDFCLENVHKAECSLVKMNSLADFIPASTNELCCNKNNSVSDLCPTDRTNPPVNDNYTTYGNMLNSPKSVDAKCVSERGSCMLASNRAFNTDVPTPTDPLTENNRLPYVMDFPQPCLGTENFAFDDKHFKSKVPLSYELSRDCEKTASYSDIELHSRTEFFGPNGFNQCNRTLQKCCPNQEIVENSDSLKSNVEHSEQ